MKLPYFRFHPTPLRTGAVVESTEVCECCGQARGYLYDGHMYAVVEVARVCPWCIAEGSVAAKWDAEFTDGQFVDSAGHVVQLSADLYAEVFQRTPGFATFQPVEWWVHCGRPAAFLRLDDDHLHFECVVCGAEHQHHDLD